ncbi:MAG: hypothetical protein ACD_15C00228G0001 [uncultured bacterium]|nr:MAG: hypothetical protein ACD_15C00228G0001 [uncultured bacterium]
MSKIHLTKEYERDISLIMEALWAQKMSRFVPERFGIESPHEVFIVFYVTSENMQIWENKEALDWYKDRLLDKNLQGTLFIEGIVSDYKKTLNELEKYWENGPISDREALEEYMKLLEEGITLFSVWYYALVDERTPEDIRRKLLELRSTDEFFAKNDIFIKGCVKKLGIDNNLANFIFPEEFLNLPNVDILRERTRGVISVGDENFITTLNQFASEKPRYFFEGLVDKFDNVREVCGQVAFKGRMKGRVKIVKNKKQMQEVRSGDIMVSPMTTPDFLPAMKLAAAFVTDEGSITCHAAIIAREMKKPCIIGTKIATQVLKDGDLVEVDADNGIVRKIK